MATPLFHLGTQNPLPVPAPVVAVCRARLSALQPRAVATSCEALEAALADILSSSSQPAAAALDAAVISAAGAAAPVEVVALLRARTAFRIGRHQLLVAGERIGQVGEAAAGRQLLRRRAEEAGLRRAGLRSRAPYQPVWDAPELQLVLAAARRSLLVRHVEAAERTLQVALRGVDVALERQQQIVAKLRVY